MSSLNKVQLIGRLGRDPELRYTNNQRPFAKVSMATSEKFSTKDGERREKTEWHNLVIWGRQAEIFNQYMRKGRQVYVEGRIEYREYDDPNSGQKRHFTDIVVDRFVMIGGDGGGQGGGGGYGQGGGQGGYGGGGGGYDQGGYGGGQSGGGYGGGQGGQSGGGYGGGQGGGYGGDQGGGYGGGGQGGQSGGGQSAGYVPPGGGQGGGQGGGGPMSYGEETDVPESDDFNDDDIPF